jgi:hypothetical protein
LRKDVYLYLGAKHMVTGYDHLLFLFGVLANIHASAYLVDAIIGLSVVYKAFDNLGGFKTLFGFEPNQKAAVLIFGLFHGFGLATKIQEMAISPDGLLANLVSFNVGVEFGQLLALSLSLILMTMWRSTAGFQRNVLRANAALMCAGFVLIGYQLSGYFTSSSSL